MSIHKLVSRLEMCPDVIEDSSKYDNEEGHGNSVCQSNTAAQGLDMLWAVASRPLRIFFSAPHLLEYRCCPPQNLTVSRRAA
jgi:hypothetical protein